MIRRRPFVLAMQACAALACVFACAAPGRLRAEEPASLRVFYTGHSFHMFVPSRMTAFCKAAGVKEYQTAGTQGIGGSRVVQHWDLAEEKNQAKKALAKGDVDIFTMAAHVKIPDEGIDRFVELGLKHNPKMRFLVQESWVPFDSLSKRIKNNAERDEADPKLLRVDQEKWRGEMEAQVKALNDKAGRDAVRIIPAGDAVLNLRELIVAGKAPGLAKQSALFTDPIGHGTAPLVALCSYCNYVCITGRDPSGLKLANPAVGEELDALLQKIAWETVTGYPMSGVKRRK